MKKYSKRFLLLMMQMMICCSLVMSPIAHAKKDPPKTQFDNRDMDAQHADSELTNKDLQTFERNMKRDDAKFGVDYIAMLAGMLFAMTALTGPLPKRYNNAKSDCPMDISGQITIPLMKIAGLTFIIGEIYNLIKFSKIKGKVMEMDGQLNYDKTVKTEDMEENSEYKTQIETYDKLNDIYWEQWKSFRTKRDIYTAVIVAIRAAEVIDGGMGIACMGVCTAKTAMYKARAAANINAVRTDVPIFMSAVGFCPLSVMPQAACTVYSATALGRVNTIEGSMLKTDGMSAKQLAEDSKDSAKAIAESPAVVAGLLASTAGAVDTSAADSMFKFEQTAVNRDIIEASQNLIEQQADRTSTQATMKSTKGALDACLSAAQLELNNYILTNYPPAFANTPIITACTQGLARANAQVYARGGVSAGIKGAFTGAEKAIKAVEKGAEKLDADLGSFASPDAQSLQPQTFNQAAKASDSAKDEAKNTMDETTKLINSSITKEPFQEDLEATLNKKLTCCGSRGVGEGKNWENPTLRVAVPKPPGMAMLRRDVKPKNEGEGLMEKAKKFFKDTMGKITAEVIHEDFLPYFESEEKLMEVAFSNMMYQKAFRNLNQSFNLPLGPMMRQLALANLSHELKTNTELSFLQLRQVAFNNFHGQYMEAIGNQNIKKSKILDMGMIALSNIGISNAHAKKGNATAAAMGVIGGLLALVLLGSTKGKVGSFVKKLGNLIEKIYSMMTRSMLTRTLFWVIYDALVSTLKKNAKKEMGLIEEQMEVIDKLKEQVAGTADATTVVDGERSGISEATGRDYEARFSAERDQGSYSKIGKDKLAREDCISVGKTAELGGCPGQVSSRNVKIRGMKRLRTQSPMGYKGTKMSIETAKGVSGAGASGMDKYLGANMDKMHKFNAAVSKTLKRQRARIKKENSKNDHKLSKGTLDAKKKANSALQNFVNNLKNGNLRGALNGSAATSSGPSAMDNMSGTVRKSGNTASYSPRPSVKPYAPKFPNSGSNNNYNSGYGYDDDDNDDSITDSSAGNDQQEELVYDYNSMESDIEKRKEVSLFKLLSNRYIISYPRILRESMIKRKEKPKPNEPVKSRKEDEIEDILDN